MVNKLKICLILDLNQCLRFTHDCTKGLGHTDLLIILKMIQRPSRIVLSVSEQYKGDSKVLPVFQILCVVCMQELALEHIKLFAVQP